MNCMKNRKSPSLFRQEVEMSQSSLDPPKLLLIMSLAMCASPSVPVAFRRGLALSTVGGCAA
jgi:hypothetical protein